ncbi:MAG: hypothetical protein ACFFCS_21215 [Candidatus Hodarchaeota archaeon]
MKKKQNQDLEPLKEEVKRLTAVLFTDLGFDLTAEMSQELDALLNDEKEIKDTLEFLKDGWTREKMINLAKSFLRISINNGKPLGSDDLIDWKPSYVSGRKIVPVENPLESVESLAAAIWNMGLYELPPGWSWYLEELKANRMTIDDILKLEPSKPEANERIYKQPDFYEMKWEIITVDGDFIYEFFSFVDFVHYNREIMKVQSTIGESIT